MSEAAFAPGQRPSQTKIVATVGPASEAEPMLLRLIRAGVDVFRLNAAHGSREEHEARLKAIRRAAESEGRPVAVLVDLAGPKIRLGELPDGKLQCSVDQVFRFVRGAEGNGPGELTTTYEPLIDELTTGDRVMLADGTVGLVVEEVGEQAAVCRVTQPGLIRSRQGVNLPGVRLSVPTLGDADRENAVWAARNAVDFLGLSFVRSANDIRQLQAIISEEEAQTQVIAKIEKPEALKELKEIVDAADGVMVARGDLGVEIDIAGMAVAQKRIVTLCNRRRKPVIIATQMLDSMTHARLPTRAEATDVANAILDGTDACMLSGETAIGEHPVEAVEMMHRIALATEPLFRKRRSLPGPDLSDEAVDAVTESTAYAAAQVAEQLDASMLVVASTAGETARTLSKQRTFIPIAGVSNSPTTLRRMCLYWGVVPIPGAPTDDARRLLEFVVEAARTAGHVTTGDRVVLLTGTHLGAEGHNAVVVHEVE